MRHLDLAADLRQVVVVMATNDNEPWLPPGHAERLVVGARVRIRLSSECRIGVLHGSREDGVTGMIGDVDESEHRARDAHTYLVWFDHGFTSPKMGAWYYTASELEPLDQSRP